MSTIRFPSGRPEAVSLPPLPWIYRAAMWKVAVASFALGAVVSLIMFGVQITLVRKNFQFQEVMLISSTTAGVLTGWLTYKAMCYAIQRRQALIHRVHVVAETNHHIRNALQSIQLSAYSLNDKPTIDAINDATARIDWVLSEVLTVDPPRDRR
ncbi:MAG TPA: hypothetical protein VEB03_00600 [Candidatus Nanoarchaeia archaeon]|nr:hypothetical protein [Candidatus Nanoarchaeia archaeon]